MVNKTVEFGQVLKQVPLSGRRAKDPLQERQNVEEAHILQEA